MSFPIACSAVIIPGMTGKLTILERRNIHGGTEEHMERAGNPNPNVLLMLSIALALWVLVYVAATSVGYWRKGRHETITESKQYQQVAAIAGRVETKLPTRRRTKVNRRRPQGTSLVARVFRSTI